MNRTMKQWLLPLICRWFGHKDFEEVYCAKSPRNWFCRQMDNSCCVKPLIRNFHLSLLNMTVLNGGYMCIPDGLVLVIRLSAGGRFTKMSKMLCAF